MIRACWKKIRDTPLPVAIVALVLGLFVPLGFHLWVGIRHWQVGGTPFALLTDPFFWTVGLGRCVGGVLLAVLLLCFRNPASITITVTAVWLTGPPIDLLIAGINLLAASAGRAAWPSSFAWLPLSLVVP